MAEANVGARAVKDGADCLVIDAESQYQGRYAAAQTYIDAAASADRQSLPGRTRGLPLRRLPPELPLLGVPRPGRRSVQPAADVLGGHRHDGVDASIAHTYEYNEIYRRPIFPLGQLWGRLSASSIEQFNTLAKAYGATGVSWWDWQSAPLLLLRTDITQNSAAAGHLHPAHSRQHLPRQQGRPRDLGAGAPLRAPGYKLAIDGDFGATDAEGGQGLPGQAPAHRPAASSTARPGTRSIATRRFQSPGRRRRA